MTDDKKDPPLNPALRPKAEGERDVYMVHVNSGGAVFVKELEFFRSQGGFREDWGKAWRPVVATSIEDAHAKGQP